MSESNVTLYQALLGPQQSLDAALSDASKRIAEIGQRNTTIVRRVVRRDGMSSTKLYDLPERQEKIAG